MDKKNKKMTRFLSILCMDTVLAVWAFCPNAGHNDFENGMF